ncbi:MAG: DUF2341 domain-containing protein [Candidatus Bathyarchaeia archaeon]
MQGFVNFINFIDINRVFGQQISITLKWKANAGTANTWIGPLAADLNNDGFMEIVITGGYGIAVLDPLNGSVIWRQPYGGSHAPFEIVDLNKDGIPEILLAPEWEYVNGTIRTRGGLIALHGNNGSVYWDNKKAYAGGKFIGVADINADGYPEIFTCSQGGVSALTYDGRIFASAYNYYTCWGGVTVGDTDFDGVFEVYLGDRSEWYPSYPSGGKGLRAFWADNLTERWCKPEILCSSHAPVLADVDKDGDLEIIILNQRGGIGVFNTDGSVNTYKGKYRYSLDLGLTCHSNPTVADVDGDGNLELITNGNAKMTLDPPKIWDLVDWKLDATLPFPSMEPPGVADVDGDGKLEIIAPNPRNVTIFKYNSNTKNYDIVYTIPIAYAHEFFIAQDIDNDGKLELVFNLHNSWVYVYDVEAPAPSPKPRSGRYFYSEYRTRVPVYVPPPGPPAPKITEISPNDGATNVPLTLSELSFKLTDYQCDLINYTVTTSPNIGSASGINVINGKISVPISGLTYSTTYVWTVTATDGANTISKTFTFKVMDLSPWYNTDWRYRKAIIIDHTKVVADQTNFPVLIDLTDPYLKTKAQPDGADILFTDQNQVKLSHEIEHYDNITGRLIAWVKVPSLSSTVNTVIYMYYGNSYCENQQNPTEVWTENYKLVLHLNEETGVHQDSTVYRNNGLTFGNLTQGAVGHIGNCVEFNGGYIELPKVCTNESQFTFSAWVYPRAGARYIISEWYSSQGAFLQVSSDYSKIDFYINDLAVSAPITFNSWYYVVGAFDGATARLYINDCLPVSKSASNPQWPSQNMYIGDRSDHTRKFYGFIDEVRVSSIARSQSWILTEYNNQLNPSTFYTICPEEEFFTSEAYLTVLIEGEGLVTKIPDSEKYAYGTLVKLMAVASAGYTFSHWEGNLTGDKNPATILMTGNKTVKAVFIKSEYTLTINVEGSGSVSRNDTGPYYYGSVVQLTATPDPHWEFVEWSGDCNETENTITITIIKNITITARFAKQKYIINASVEGIGGTIQPSGLVIVEYGQSQTFIITPDEGYHIFNVIVDGTSIGPKSSYTFDAVDSNHIIIVSFAQKVYTLTVSIIGEGSVELNPEKEFYTHGEIVQLTAIPRVNWTFSGWNGDLSGLTNPINITMTGNKNVTATFTISEWWHCDWKYRKKITINHTEVAGELLDFPVLIELNDSNLAQKAQQDGDDIVFTDVNNTKLSHQIEFYNSTTGHLIVWVKVPYLSSVTDTILYMYYGNPYCESQQDPTGVWDINYKLVLHLNENAGIHYDSTMNDNDGTPFGNLVQGAVGHIGNCVEFNGGYILLPRVCTNETQFTFSAWIYPRAGARFIISERRNYQGAYLQVSSDGKYIEFYVNNVEVSSKRITLNTWYYVVGTFDGLTARLYLNGQLHSSLPASLTWPSDSMYVGDAYSHIVKFYGFIDEVRVSSIARSQSWILTEYNNQLNPSTFYTIGPEEQYAYNNSAVGEYFDSFNNNILQTGNTNKLESQQETNLAYLTPITWLAAIPIGLKPRQSHARNKNRNKCRLVLQQATLGIELYGTAAHTSAYHKPQAKSITPYN